MQSLFLIKAEPNCQSAYTFSYMPLEKNNHPDMIALLQLLAELILLLEKDEYTYYNRISYGL